MKSREALLKFKRFQVEERRRRVSQIEAMIAEFGRMAGDLDREIEGEEKPALVAEWLTFVEVEPLQESGQDHA